MGLRSAQLGCAPRALYRQYGGNGSCQGCSVPTAADSPLIKHRRRAQAGYSLSWVHDTQSSLLRVIYSALADDQAHVHSHIRAYTSTSMRWDLLLAPKRFTLFLSRIGPSSSSCSNSEAQRGSRMSPHLQRLTGRHPIAMTPPVYSTSVSTRTAPAP